MRCLLPLPRCEPGFGGSLGCSTRASRVNEPGWRPERAGADAGALAPRVESVWSEIKMRARLAGGGGASGCSTRRSMRGGRSVWSPSVASWLGLVAARRAVRRVDFRSNPPDRNPPITSKAEGPQDSAGLKEAPILCPSLAKSADHSHVVREEQVPEVVALVGPRESSGGPSQGDCLKNMNTILLPPLPGGDHLPLCLFQEPGRDFNKIGRASRALARGRLTLTA